MLSQLDEDSYSRSIVKKFLHVIDSYLRWPIVLSIPSQHFEYDILIQLLRVGFLCCNAERM